MHGMQAGDLCDVSCWSERADANAVRKGCDGKYGTNMQCTLYGGTYVVVIQMQEQERRKHPCRDLDTMSPVSAYQTSTPIFTALKHRAQKMR